MIDFLNALVKTACIVNGVQLQADLSGSTLTMQKPEGFRVVYATIGSNMVAGVVHRASTHEIKTHNRIIEVGVSERSAIVGVAGISDGDGFLHGCLFAVVELEFQFQEMTGF